MERGRAGGDVERDEGQEDGEGRTHARICTRTSARARHTHTHTHARTHTHTHTRYRGGADVGVEVAHAHHVRVRPPRRPRHHPLPLTARSRRGHGAVTARSPSWRVTVWSRCGHGGHMAGSRRLSAITVRSRCGHGEVTESTVTARTHRGGVAAVAVTHTNTHTNTHTHKHTLRAFAPLCVPFRFPLAPPPSL